MGPVLFFPLENPLMHMIIIIQNKNIQKPTQGKFLANQGRNQEEKYLPEGRNGSILYAQTRLAASNLDRFHRAAPGAALGRCHVEFWDWNTRWPCPRPCPRLRFIFVTMSVPAGMRRQWRAAQQAMIKWECLLFSRARELAVRAALPHCLQAEVPSPGPRNSGSCMSTRLPADKHTHTYTHTHTHTLQIHHSNCECACVGMIIPHGIVHSAKNKLGCPHLL